MRQAGTEIVEYEKEITNLDHQLKQFKTNEELQKLNALKKRYSNQLSVINADLAAEEQKRKKLEDEVSKANSKANYLSVNIIFQKSSHVKVN